MDWTDPMHGFARRMARAATAHTAPEDAFAVRRGSMRDYAALAHLHYRGGRPATCTRVLVIAPIGVADHPPVGVLVESMPVLACRLRDAATGGRYAGADRRAAIARLNAEVRCVSRVVVHPRWRGLGLGVRLVRHALGAAATRFTEALAAMGRVHPLFERAGMTPHFPDGDGPVYYLRERR